MNISDPIADMLTRVRNASRARHTEVVVPASRTKREIARILKDEGFIADVSEERAGPSQVLRLQLKYVDGKAPVVSGRLFYCTSAGGFVDHEIPLNEQNRRSGLEALEIIDRAIELGFLPAAPAERACTWCDFRPVCGPDEPRRVARKMREKLGDLDALREKP